MTQVSILPAGSAVLASLEKGTHKLQIINVASYENSDRCDLYVKFPDGFIKSFQANGLDELAPKLTNQLRGRYGVEAISFVETPVLEKGSVFTIEVL